MQKVISETKKTEVLVRDIREGSLAAYRMASDNNAYAVLARINKGQGYAFVPLNCSNSNYRYHANSWYDSLEKAAAMRDVRTFSSHDEMIEAMYKKEF
jgi:hypothetical protein